MYQIGAKWALWDLGKYLSEEIETISLRGYDREKTDLPADLYVYTDDVGELMGLSVALIASGYCPTKRDIYLEKKLKIKSSEEHVTWGRIAGKIVEEYLVGILDYFNNVAKKPSGLDYQIIQLMADDYSSKFWSGRATQIKSLKTAARNNNEAPERLIFLLRQTTKYELTLLAADYKFSKKRFRKFVPLVERLPIRYDSKSVTIQPNEFLGLSEITTPDFIIPSTEIIIGEVKTGKNIEQKHLHTLAGYALAYESQFQKNVNFGIVYFFETHVEQFSFAQSYIFVINDFLRRKFLDARVSVYSVLQQGNPPVLAKHDEFCQFCKYEKECYPISNGKS